MFFPPSSDVTTSGRGSKTRELLIKARLNEGERERKREERERQREREEESGEARGWWMESHIRSDKNQSRIDVTLYRESPVSQCLLFNFPNEHTSVIVGVVARRTDEYRRYVYQPFSEIDM